MTEMRICPCCHRRTAVADMVWIHDKSGHVWGRTCLACEDRTIAHLAGFAFPAGELPEDQTPEKGGS